MKTLLILAAAFAALPAAAEDFIGLVSAINPNKECAIDGPDVDKTLVGKLYLAKTQSGQLISNGAVKVMKSEKPLYCHAAKMVAFQSWGKDLAKKMKGETVKNTNTAKFDKYTKLYADLYSAGWCEPNSGLEDKWTEDLQGELRSEYVKTAKPYLAGAKDESARNDAIYTLSWVTVYGHKGECATWLEGERKALSAALSEK